MRLSHNMNSLTLYNKYRKNLKVSDSTMNKIGSGVKIGRAKDDPGKLGQSESMKIKIKSMQVAQRNLQDGISMLQTADGALQEVNNMLTRVKELAVSAADGTKTEDDRAIIETEVNELLEGVNDIANNTMFNGLKLLGNKEVVDNRVPKYQVATTGDQVGENMRIALYNINSNMLADDKGNKLSDINVMNPKSVGDAMYTIDAAINTITDIRSQYGAISNAFESTYDRLTSSTDLVQSASSKITDADIAEEMVQLSRSGILYQTQIALIAQSNQFPMDALKVLDKL